MTGGGFGVDVDVEGWGTEGGGRRAGGGGALTGLGATHSSK